MEKPKRERGRPKGVAYPERIQVYETTDGKELLRRLAAKWGETEASTVRRAVREAAKREGVE